MNKYRTYSQRLAPLLAIFLSFSVASAASASEGTDGIQTELQADNLPIVAAGETIYQAQCASCHGAQLEGQPNWRKRNEQGFLPAPPHDKTGHTWHHADDLLFEITKYGAGVVIGDSSYQSLMPAFQSILSDQEIIAALSFIKNTWPEEERSWQEEINGSQGGGFIPPEKKTSILDKLFK
jgi:mono/diheme cytochrome c family protein